MKIEHTDVAIVGGGPAGAATALALRSDSPDLSVTLVEMSDYSAMRIGETVHPSFRSLLEHLDVADRFEKDGHVEAFGTCAAWGQPSLRDNEFVYSRNGHGWHLDRARFDAMLADEAGHRGVQLRRGSRVVTAEFDHEGCRLSLNHADCKRSELRASIVVDATGRKAKIASEAGAKRVRFDDLVAIVGICDLSEDARDTYTLIEADELGWWYSSRLPGRQRIVAFMTDADVARDLDLKSSARFVEQLRRTSHTSPLSRPERLRSPLILRSAATQKLDKMAGDQWIAVGDAAACFDPLSSRGIHSAVKSGILASHVIRDRFAGITSGPAKYTALMDAQFRAYLEKRREVYSEEQRWPHSEFWSRRSRINEFSELAEKVAVSS